MLLPIDMIVPRLRVFEATVALFAEKSRCGAYWGYLRPCLYAQLWRFYLLGVDCECFAELSFRLKVAVDRLQVFPIDWLWLLSVVLRRSRRCIPFRFLGRRFENSPSILVCLFWLLLLSHFVSFNQIISILLQSVYRYDSLDWLVNLQR